MHAHLSTSVSISSLFISYCNFLSAVLIDALKNLKRPAPNIIEDTEEVLKISLCSSILYFLYDEWHIEHNIGDWVHFCEWLFFLLHWKYITNKRIYFRFKTRHTGIVCFSGNIYHKFTYNTFGWTNFCFVIEHFCPFNSIYEFAT